MPRAEVCNTTTTRGPGASVTIRSDDVHRIEIDLIPRHMGDYIHRPILLTIRQQDDGWSSERRCTFAWSADAREKSRLALFTNVIDKPMRDSGPCDYVHNIASSFSRAHCELTTAPIPFLLKENRGYPCPF